MKKALPDKNVAIVNITISRTAQILDHIFSIFQQDVSIFSVDTKLHEATIKYIKQIYQICENEKYEFPFTFDFSFQEVPWVVITFSMVWQLVRSELHEDYGISTEADFILCRDTFSCYLDEFTINIYKGDTIILPGGASVNFDVNRFGWQRPKPSLVNMVNSILDTILFKKTLYYTKAIGIRVVLFCVLFYIIIFHASINKYKLDHQLLHVATVVCVMSFLTITKYPGDK